MTNPEVAILMLCLFIVLVSQVNRFHSLSQWASDSLLRLLPVLR